MNYKNSSSLCQKGPKGNSLSKGPLFFFYIFGISEPRRICSCDFFVLWGLENKLPFWNNSFTVEIQSKGPFNSAKTIFWAYLIIYLVENKLKWPFWLNFNSETVVSKGPLWRSFAKLWSKGPETLVKRKKSAQKTISAIFFF